MTPEQQKDAQANYKQIMDETMKKYTIEIKEKI